MDSGSTSLLLALAEWTAGAYSSLNAVNKQVDEMLTIWQEKWRADAVNL
jgi:hypothetical protein